ncbi:MAG: UDP-N-acetyl-D-mannosamine dehydrogenase [Spirochaetia bacterium]|nr:UDP-N-acetyl-D-mannosamine dehydrogenase [Spirochaetia bacterium]
MIINTNKKVCVLGLGYIGLPTSALLANRGFQVRGVDVKQSIVDTINNGDIHIVEPDLDTFVRAAVESGNLRAYLTPDYADVFIIAVPTPFKNNYEPNIDYVLQSVESMAPFLKKENIIILESTSPPGTTEKIKEILVEKNVDVSNIYIAHCPERVLPGFIMKELIENDRIIGGINYESTLKAAEFYKTFVKGEVIFTDAKTAELSKLTENSFRDVNIAFANELSMICDKLNIDVHELIQLANHHPRVNILNPGPGVGGHCIAVDPWFIVHSAPENSSFIKKARETNLLKTKWVIEKIKKVAYEFENKNNKKPVIGCFGLAYKADIDDLRESPALEIAKEIKSDNHTILAVEPNCDEVKEFQLFSFGEAFEKSDICVFLVAHKEFKEQYEHKNKIILDFCGVTKKKL